MTDYSSVCDDEADLWRKCVEQHLGMPEVEVTCQLHEDHFHQCVQKWRSDVGPGVILKGANEGEPPPQCAAMSCLVGACLRQHNYDFKRCKPPMDFFKRCVKGFYGSEYIM